MFYWHEIDKKLKIYEIVKLVSDIRQLEHLLLDADRAFLYQMIENSQFEQRKKCFTLFHPPRFGGGGD